MSLSVEIKKKFENFTLQVKLEKEKGILGLLGASGSGKSVTLQCIAGLLTPDEGKICLNGRTLFDSEKGINLPPQERRVGYLFQNYALFPHMTVEKNILCGLSAEKDRKKRREKMQEAAKLFQIEPILKKYPGELSGGQQQRTALARILVSEPELLLLDEPFSALDAYLRDQLQIQVRELLEHFGRDTVLVSHSRDEVYQLCSRLALLEQGEILECGETKAVFQNPGSRTGAVLTGCKNIAAARKTGEYEVEMPEWGVRFGTARSVGDNLVAVGVRAHHFSPDEEENSYPVVCSGKMEGPFETTVLFQYGEKERETGKLWWRISGEQKAEKLPERLGVAAEHILLLYH